MTRSVVTIEDLTDDDVEALFGLVDEFLANFSTPGRPWRIRGRCRLAEEHILATLFHEPSTRTRLSFESAMLRLGGEVISCPDGHSTSFSKGESIADTVRVVENYSDLIVIRHPWEGAARVAADFAKVPVINAGDGSHEHPTQTLCDLYTLRSGQLQKESHRGERSLPELLRNMSVVLCGDLNHGRTVHSLVYALARFGAQIIPLPASARHNFPEHVRKRLARDYHCYPHKHTGAPEDEIPADVVYMPPEKPNQLSLFHPESLELPIKTIKGVDFFYQTRLQRERQDGTDDEMYPVVDSEFLKRKPYRNSQVMHPLPRVDELGYDVDEDARGVYFQQASYGVPVRMALIAGLLELKPFLKGSPRRYEEYAHPETIACSNTRCVTAQPSERRYLKNRFWILEDERPTVRCAYCDFEQEPKIVARKSTGRFRSDAAGWRDVADGDLLLFPTEADALQAGLKPTRGAASGVET